MNRLSLWCPFCGGIKWNPLLQTSYFGVSEGKCEAARAAWLPVNASTDTRWGFSDRAHRRLQPSLPPLRILSFPAARRLSSEPPAGFLRRLLCGWISSGWTQPAGTEWWVSAGSIKTPSRILACHRKRGLAFVLSIYIQLIISMATRLERVTRRRHAKYVWFPAVILFKCKSSKGFLLWHFRIG